jgi:hypothetical protein
VNNVSRNFKTIYEAKEGVDFMTRSLQPGEKFEDIYEPSSSGLSEFRRSDAVEMCLGELEILVAELRGKEEVLPKVDPDGSSECPFAEDLYRAKADAQQAVMEKLNVARSLLEREQKEQKRCETNLQRIEGDMAKLNEVVAKQAYGVSLGLQEQEYVNVQRNIGKLQNGISKATLTMDQATQYTFPIPLGEVMDVGGPSVAGQRRYAGENSGLGTDNLVDDLIEMGPMELPKEIL